MSQRGRPFQPGNTFGRGRPPGSRNKTITLVQELLNEYAAPMTRKAIAESLQGNSAIMRLVLDRILPARREAPVKIGSLPTRTAAEVSKASETVLHKVASGKLAIAHGAGYLNLLETRRRIIETEELEKRISTLESKS